MASIRYKLGLTKEAPTKPDEGPIRTFKFQSQDHGHFVRMVDLRDGRVPLRDGDEALFESLKWQPCIQLIILWPGFPTFEEVIWTVDPDAAWLTYSTRTEFARVVARVVYKFMVDRVNVVLKPPHDRWTINELNGIRFDQVVIEGVHCVDGVCVVKLKLLVEDSAGRHMSMDFCDYQRWTPFAMHNPFRR